jgi:hypothetical protein
LPSVGSRAIKTRNISEIRKKGNFLSGLEGLIFQFDIVPKHAFSAKKEFQIWVFRVSRRLAFW